MTLSITTLSKEIKTSLSIVDSERYYAESGIWFIAMPSVMILNGVALFNSLGWYYIFGVLWYRSRKDHLPAEKIPKKLTLFNVDLTYNPTNGFRSTLLFQSPSNLPKSSSVCPFIKFKSFFKLAKFTVTIVNRNKFECLSLSGTSTLV